ncbi:MAG: hypothetical protein J0L88_02960 [Xanthomonadales bacterium]|nr:hypothetical protein [Xanthomonadales bacterium]
MDNILPFPSTARALPAGIGLLPVDDEDEIAIRRWELVMSGQRGSEEYQRLEAHLSHRMSRWDHGRQLPPR